MGMGPAMYRYGTFITDPECYELVCVLCYSMESVLESLLDQCASPQEMARALTSSMPER